MARIEAREAERQAAVLAAGLMAAGARTAPKTRGLDSLRTVILDGEDVQALAAAMEAKHASKPTKLATIARDAGNVRAAAAVLLLGVTGEPKRPEVPLDCGACGYAGCQEFIAASKEEGQDFRGPLCIYQVMDLGIALGVAAKLGSELCMDSRIMYSLGAAARQAGYLKDCDVIIGLPLSVTGKNPYFDRP